MHERENHFEINNWDKSYSYTVKDMLHVLHTVLEKHVEMDV
jgi:hypothetical protein